MPKEDRRQFRYGDYPYYYQAMDEVHLRGRWEEAFDHLVRDIESGAKQVDLEEFRDLYDLPAGWTWQDVRRRIENNPSPEDEFNFVLGRLYRAEDEELPANRLQFSPPGSNQPENPTDSAQSGGDSPAD